MNSLKIWLTKRTIFITVGILNFLVFHFAIYRLFLFLLNNKAHKTSDSYVQVLFVDSLLIALFTIPHSLMLTSKLKSYLLNYVPTALYPTLYSLHASLSLILMDKYWLSFSGFKLVEMNQLTKNIIIFLYILSWIMMLWAMLSTGLFKQSGIEDWWLGLKQRPAKNSLMQAGAYRFCRHPIYVAFLGMIWMTPYMTVDRLYLAFIWTVYIVVGAGFKEARLRKNKRYLDYASKTPAFPFVPLKLDKFFSRIIWRLE